MCRNDDYDQDGDGFQTVVWNEDLYLVVAIVKITPQRFILVLLTSGMMVLIRTVMDLMILTKTVMVRALDFMGGLDCDDTDSDINTSVEAVNGLDDDCDGVVDNPVPA